MSFMRHVVVPLVGVAALSVTLLAQSPAFEVATIKTNRSASRNSGAHIPDVGRFDATNITTQHLLMYAFSVRPFQIVGGPNWMLEDRFDIIGKPPDDAAPKSLPKMIEAMLIDRFALIAHKEMREQPIYALVLASSEQAIYVLTTARADRTLGRELRRAPVVCEGVLAAGQPGKRDTCIMSGPFNGQFIFRGQSLESLASGLSLLLNRVVLDKTALEGAFDGDITFDPRSLPGMPLLGSSDQAPSDKPALDTALRDQLGLKLESARGPVEVLVIDHVERPTEN